MPPGTVYLYVPVKTRQRLMTGPEVSEADRQVRHQVTFESRRPVHAHAGHTALVSGRPGRRYCLRVFHP